MHIDTTVLMYRSGSVIYRSPDTNFVDIINVQFTVSLLFFLNLFIFTIN